MEDLKWLLRRCRLPILLFLILVIAGMFCWGKMHPEKQKVAEEVWEPPAVRRAMTELDAPATAQPCHAS